jgi:hypothetical protein
MELSVFKSDLQITSREKAIEFYKCVKCTHLIPAGLHQVGGKIEHIFIRVEPGYHISRITSGDLEKEVAWAVPSFYDPYGNIAYRWRKPINAWLRGE